MRRLFEVNSEPHTGARPSVRLCVGLINCLLIGALFFPASILIRFIFDKMEAPRGALRQYNADEL